MQECEIKSCPLIQVLVTENVCSWVH